MGPLLPDVSTLHAILEHAPGFIVFLDPSFEIRYINRTGYGYTMDDIVGHNLLSFYGPEETTRLRKALECARETREEQFIDSYIDALSVHARVWFSHRIAALHDASSQLIGFVQITADVTEQKNRELQLKKVQADLLEASHRAGMAEVATGVLHNVGNVLNSINVSASTLTTRLESPHLDMLGRAVRMCEEQGESLPSFIAHDPRGRKLPALFARLFQELSSEREAIRAELKRLAEHVNMIRAIVTAQQSMAKASSAVEEVRPRELIERALSVFHLDLTAHHIELSTEVDDSARIMLDKQATLQILVNLLRNAIEALEAAPSPRKLDIKVHQTADLIHFDITENGAGISAENLGNLFRHGFTTKPSGHGFGLHTSAISARAMGGTLEGTSDGPGKGARFRLSLPRRQALS